MKLSNIFKKETKTDAKAKVETLAKNQLEKVIGGADDTTTAVTSTDTSTKTGTAGVMGGKAKAWMVNN
jgi:hypothetical protein